MRCRVQSGGTTVQAIAGNHAVFLGLDLTDGRATAASDSRSTAPTTRSTKATGWPGSRRSSRSCRSRIRTSSTARSSTRCRRSTGATTRRSPRIDYSYRVVPRYGAPAALEDRPASRRRSTSRPATRRGRPRDLLQPRRRREPGVRAPVREVARQAVGGEAEGCAEWLSRGLFEAILAYIRQAKNGDFALRAAVYEFTQPDVLAAFRRRTSTAPTCGSSTTRSTTRPGTQPRRDRDGRADRTRS